MSTFKDFLKVFQTSRKSTTHNHLIHICNVNVSSVDRSPKLNVNTCSIINQELKLEHQFEDNNKMMISRCNMSLI